MNTAHRSSRPAPAGRRAALGFPLRNAPRWILEGAGRRALLVLPLAAVTARLGHARARPSAKSRHEWIVHTPHGPAAVYDYAVPAWPDDAAEVAVEWHLGAHHHLAAAWIARYLISGCAHLTDPTAPRCRHCTPDADQPRPAVGAGDAATSAPATSGRTP